MEDFNLEIEKGELVSFLGPSGCGKTTTLRMVAGFEVPTSGRIELSGADITSQPPNQRNVGMVFQAYALFPNMTVADNVGFGLKVAKKTIANFIEKASRLYEQKRRTGFSRLSACDVRQKMATVVHTEFRPSQQPFPYAMKTSRNGWSPVR